MERNHMTLCLLHLLYPWSSSVSIRMLVNPMAQA
jgi:hypothetical protein